MTDTPKFTVVDRRKFRDASDEAAETAETSTPSNVATMPAPEPPRQPEPEPPKAESKPGPRLTLVEPPSKSEETFEDESGEIDLPGAPTAEESHHQKLAYEQAAERIDDLVRAQNPGAPPMEKAGFEHLLQQLYLSALMQMGAGTPEGQRPRVDIVGARQTIDLIGVLAEKVQGNLSQDEDRALQAILFELRMTFVEITRAVTASTGPLPPPPGAKR
jgi:hypothetical protein